jgi:hypothetical protein
MLVVSLIAILASASCFISAWRESHRHEANAPEMEPARGHPADSAAPTAPAVIQGVNQQPIAARGAALSGSPRVSFRHVYFNTEKRGRDIGLEAREALLVLKMGASAEDIGDSFLQGAKFESLEEKEVAALFGPEFAISLGVQEADEWRGPIVSKYGLHVVRVEKAPATYTVSEGPRGAVRDFSRERRLALSRVTLGQARGRYGAAKAGPPSPETSVHQ